MIWLYFLLLIIVAVLAYVLLAPIYIEVDSERNLCRVRVHQLMSMQLFVKESLFMELRITWWHRWFDLLAARNRKTKPKKNVERKAVIPYHKILAVLRTFKIRKCEVNIDSGDNYVNGIFFPWVRLLGWYSHRNITVNFLGENRLILEIENNAARILWAFLK